MSNLRTSSRDRVWLAIALTLALHAIALLFLWMQPLSGTGSTGSDFVAVEFLADLREPVPERTLEEILSERINENVKGVSSDLSASTSEEVRSSQSASDMRQMAQDIESELRQLEQSEFERLASEQKDFGLAGVPDDGNKGKVETYSEWDKRYAGEVTLSYDVGGRRGLQVPIPGYKCRAAGLVMVAVSVNPEGRVIGARIAESELIGASTSGDGRDLLMCLEEQGVESARNSLFQAVVGETTEGMVTYRFLAQD